MPHEYHEQNRKSWNAATQQHHTHKPELIQQFKDGKNTLYPEETSLLGDVKGKKVVHLQCNDGQDTLSIANHLGADILGVDISDEAIAFAQKMSQEAGIPAQFERADIFDWFDQNTTPYEVVYTSYGALCWIADMKQWSRGVAKTLKPGGRVVIMEFHPLMLMFDWNWALTYDYMGGKTLESDGVGDYVGDDFEGEFKNPHKAFEFQWGVGDIVSALLDAGLHIMHFKEYPYCNGWKPFPDVVNKPGNRNYPPEDKPTIAMMFSIVAEKPENQV